MKKLLLATWLPILHCFVSLAIGPSAHFFLPEKVAGLKGTRSDISLGITNSGAEGMKSFIYTWNLGDGSYNGEYKFNDPLPARYDNFRYITLPIDIPEETGEYPLTLTITEIDGEVNTHSKPMQTTVLISAPVRYSNRPLVDEYTGLWCGYCPLGYVTLETLNEKYGKEFIAASWHNSDEMATMSGYPTSVNSFPNSAINRGSLISVSTLETQWEHARNQFTQAMIEVSGEFSDEEENHLKATSTVTWLENISYLDCAVGFMLVADGLSDPSWLQANNYSGTNNLTGKYADVFTDGPGKISGLVYNDVVLKSGRAKGENSCVIKSAKAFESKSYEFEFDITEFKNLYGKGIPVNASRLRIISYIYNRETSSVMNSASSEYPGNVSSKAEFEQKEEPVVTRWYELSGKECKADNKGIVIKVDIYDNGKTKSTKIMK